MLSTKVNTTMNSDELYPLALLMDELKHDAIANRVQAMRKLDTIALALGPQRTRDELLPFLTEVAQDDEDEVFTVLAEKLAAFVNFVGGKEHLPLLLPILEILASQEEPIVRDAAVESLVEVAAALTEEQILNNYIPLLEHLATAEWFSSKVSSTGLFKAALLRVDDATRKHLLSLFYQLAQDETPMVRRGAGKNLPALIELLTENLGASTDEDWDYISFMFTKLTTDQQDSVRFLSVDVLVSIQKFFNAKKVTSHTKDLLESAIKLITDEAWRVRYMAADRFEQLAVNFASQDQANVSHLVDPFLGLVRDNESEVRKAIAKQVPGFAKLLQSPDLVMEKIIPSIKVLSTDESEVVRASLASEVTNVAAVLDKEQTIEHLLPILLEMLKDEFPDVRLNIISKLQVVNKVIGIQLLSQSLLPAISELAKDKHWRVRLAIINYIPLLAEQLGVEFFDEQLSSLCLSWLWDNVYSIREAAVNNLEKLTQIFGSAWSQQEIISRLLKSENDLMDNFVYRITLLFALTKLIPVIKKDVVITDILPFVVQLQADKVPNIRFNVAKSYATLAESLLAGDKDYAETVSGEILPNLEKLVDDEDFDVRYFASQSVEKVKAVLA